MWFYKLNLPQQKPNHNINKIEAVIKLSYHQGVEKLAKKPASEYFNFFIII